MEYRFQAEIKQLLHILVHSLYTEREIFLRELISNASDALSKIQFIMLTQPNILDADSPLSIQLEFNKDEKWLKVSDSGIGMTQTELEKNLGVIAQSGIKAFLEQLQDSAAQHQLIGQFGVGFYSVFMAAEKVEVVSKSYLPDEPAHRWISDGGETFTIEPAPKTTRGTDILIHLRDDALEFAEQWKLREIIKRHSDYIEFPIYIQDTKAEDESAEESEPQAINQRTALWRQSSSQLTDEDYDNFYRSLTLDFEAPLMRIHANGDAPIQYYALLYIPKQAERTMFSLRKEAGLKLYTRKILIQEYTTDLLPDYLQFVQGVVDSEDIPLNVNRESVQDHPMIMKLKRVLTNKILVELERLSKNNPERYNEIWDEFGAYFKHGIVAAYEDREKLLPLLRFQSSQNTGLTSLADYAERMAEGQEAIYYLIADSANTAARSPHLAPFRERGLEVLYFTESVDGFMVNALRDYKGHSLLSIDADNVDLEGVGKTPESPSDETALEQSELDDLVVQIRNILGEAVQSVKISKVLTSGSPARLVTPEGALDRHTQRIYQMLDKQFEVPARIFEVNPHHPIIRNLARRWAQHESIEEMIQVLYGNALLADGIHPDPAEFVQQVQALLEAASAS